eukprot:6377050-Prymnesium_polylepis.1
MHSVARSQRPHIHVEDLLALVPKLLCAYDVGPVPQRQLEDFRVPLQVHWWVHALAHRIVLALDASVRRAEQVECRNVHVTIFRRRADAIFRRRADAIFRRRADAVRPANPARTHGRRAAGRPAKNVQTSQHKQKVHILR